MSNCKFLLLGAFLPLVVCANEELDTIYIEDNASKQETYKQSQFFSTYSKDIITKDNILESGISNTKDALKDISNVKVKNLGTFSKTLSIRGFSGERVVSVVDGVKISNHGITMAGGGELGLIDTSSIEKIEVIKGSPSVIYDPGAIGGVVRVSTIKDISKLKDRVGVKYNYLNDTAYRLDKHSSAIEAKYKSLYFNIFGSKSDSKNLNVKDKEKLQDIIEDTNIKDERTGTEFELHDLGYQSKGYGGMLGYEINPCINIFIKGANYEADDITSAYGSVDFARVFHYDKYSKKDWSIGINTKEYLKSNYINAFYAKQNIYRMAKSNSLSALEVELDSQTAKLQSQYDLGKLFLTSGGQFTKDDAKTATYSHQDYIALFLSGEYILSDKWTFSSGIRYNHHKVTQDLFPGQNRDTAYDLVGVSGVIDKPLKDDAFNYSAGIIYSINSYNNIAFNYSKSYRYPSLYERFAFGAFIGGGEEMKPEEANNFEISYKHLEEDFDYNLALFYSDFSTYNGVYEKKKLKNKTALEICNQDPKCNPYDGAENEDRIFETYNIYGSFNNVKSYGFEFDINKRFLKYKTEVGFSASMTKISDAKKSFDTIILEKKFNQEPIELSFYLSKKFDYIFNPTIKLKLRHVTNSVNVDDFSPFTVADIYLSAKYKFVNINAGVKNITNEIYHEPYMILDGTKRSFFINFSINYDSLL